MSEAFDRAWAAVEGLQPERLIDLFAAEPDRLDQGHHLLDRAGLEGLLRDALHARRRLGLRSS